MAIKTEREKGTDYVLLGVLATCAYNLTSTCTGDKDDNRYGGDVNGLPPTDREKFDQQCQ